MCYWVFTQVEIHVERLYKVSSVIRRLVGWVGTLVLTRSMVFFYYISLNNSQSPFFRHFDTFVYPVKILCPNSPGVGAYLKLHFF